MDHHDVAVLFHLIQPPSGEAFELSTPQLAGSTGAAMMTSPPKASEGWNCFSGESLTASTVYILGQGIVL